jgi:DNA transformation protein and related proteins
MAVTPAYRAYALEQLGRAVPISAKAMFGGVGIYSEGLFFALIDDDSLYFKVGDANRLDFEQAGMGPFRPFGEGSKPMHYYEVPGELLEDPEALSEWVRKALAVARSARIRRSK